MIYDIFSNYSEKIEYLEEIIYNFEIIQVLMYMVYDDKIINDDLELNIKTIIDGIVNIIIQMNEKNFVIWNQINNPVNIEFPELNVLYFTIDYYYDWKISEKFLEKKIDLNILKNFKILGISVFYKIIDDLIFQFKEYREICLRYLLYNKNKDFKLFLNYL